MKIKLTFVYIAVGIAFLAVSLWVFLSGGKSARAVAAKFRLGGILLTTWSMLSAASCTGVPQVTCYEPLPPPEVMCYDVAIESDILSVVVKDYGGNKLKPGDVLLLNIEKPTYGKYVFRIRVGEKTLLQTESFTVPESGEAGFELTLAPTEYRGEAWVQASGVTVAEDGTESERPLDITGSIVII